MNNKTFLALLAIFAIVGSMAAVFAADATLGDLKFEVPDDYKVTNSNDTAVELTNDKKTIIVSTEITGNDAVNNYLTGKGFKFNETTKGNQSVSGNQLNGHFSYDENTYSKDKGFASAYLLVKDNKPITIIGIDNDFDGDDIGDNDIQKAVGEVAKQIMLRK